MNKNVEALVFGGLILVSMVLGIFLLSRMFGFIPMPWWFFLLCLSLFIGLFCAIALKLWAQNLLIRHYERELERLRGCEQKLSWASKDIEALKREVEKILKQW